MASTKVLGPWPKGLNLTSNRDLSVFLGPDELGQADNVIITPEGFIEPRPGCKCLNAPFYTTMAADAKVSTLGIVRTPDGASVVLVEVYTPSTNVIQVYKVVDPTIPPVLYFTVPSALVTISGVPTKFHFTHVIVHKGISDFAGHEGVFFFGSQVNSAYHTTDFTLTAAPTSLVAKGTAGNLLQTPGSDGGIIVKDRLFLWRNDTNIFYWSNAFYICNFSANNNPGVGGGVSDAGNLAVEPTTSADGITSVSYLGNNFYIFKRTKSYMFTYQTSPKEDGYFRKFNEEMGAFDSTLYRNSLVVVNGKGVFRVQATEFVDLQKTLNLRFEIPIDRPNVATGDIFISAFNNDILVGFYDRTTDKKHYYCMSGYNGGWTKWNYDYISTTPIASPGSVAYTSQPSNSDKQYLIYTNFAGNRINFTEWKPSLDNWRYHLDSSEDVVTNDTVAKYVPGVVVKSSAAIGDSMLDYKKIYRTYVKFYLSEVPYTAEEFPDGLWTISVNYNKFYFNSDPALGPINPIYEFYPVTEGQQPQASPVPLGTESTVVFSGVYQIPLHQQRVKQFVFELIRKPSVAPAGPFYNPDLSNPAIGERPIKQGYYFMLSSLWFDYADKARI